MPLWVPLGVGSLCLWITGNIIDKFLLEKYFRNSKNEANGSSLFMFSALFAIPIIGMAFFMNNGVLGDLRQVGIGITSGFLTGIYLLCYFKALARAELSRIVPIFQTIPIFTFFFAGVVLHEALTISQIIAGLLILMGAALLSYHHSDERFDLISLLLILCASAAIAMQETLFKYIAIDLGYWTGILWGSVGVLLFGLGLYTLDRKARITFNAHFIQRRYSIIGLNVLNEIIDALAAMTFSAAILFGPIALVQTVSAYQPLLLLIVSFVATKLGFTFLREDFGKKSILQKTSAILLMGAGSLIIYWPMVPL